MNLKEALQIVVSESNNEYAKTYAQAALELGDSDGGKIISSNSVMIIEHKVTGKMMAGQELKVQLLYILSNLSGWKGEKAREVKKILKEYSK